MTFAYFDCFAGVAGDMVLGALLDAGGSAEVLRSGLAGVPVDPFELEVTQAERGGIGGIHVRVRAERSHVIRTWAYLRRVLGEHGMLPVPAPAVLELLQDVPIYSGGVAAELTTPTGAAILAASAVRFTDLPAMRVTAAGYGAGARQHDELPNLLRVLLGERTEDEAAGDGGVVLEAHLDDMTPELAPWVLERLFEAGAADVWYTPIHMKKGRPGITLSVLCSPGTDAAVRELLWRET